MRRRRRFATAGGEREDKWTDGRAPERVKHRRMREALERGGEMPSTDT